MSPRSLAFLIVVPVALAGCFHEDPVSPEFHATATDAKCGIGYAYDGAGLEAAGGEITIDVNEETNEGLVSATFTIGDSTFVLEWTNFTGDPTKAFQSGGIARDFFEHGDSGTGDTLLPTMWLVSAAWGTARLTVDGVESPDPYTGGSWTAHYMATTTGVRADDGKVRTADGGTYSPDAPGNGASEDGDQEIWLVLKPGGTAPDALNLTATETAQGPNYQKTFPVTVEAPGGDLHVAFSTDTGGVPALPATGLTFTLVDANGTAVQSAANEGSFDVPNALGDYEVHVTGNVTQATYDLAVTSTYPSDQHRVCVFESAQW